MKLLELLCGGSSIWNNVIIILTKQDYNPITQEVEEWEQILNNREEEAKNVM